MRWSVCSSAELSPRQHSQCSHSSSINLICAICRVAKQCPVVWLSRHVDGHQDDDLKAILDRLALLNIEMDTGAKAFMLSLPQTRASSLQDFWRTMVNLARIQEIEQILSTRYQRDLARYFPLSVLEGQGTLWILSLSKQH